MFYERVGCFHVESKQLLEEHVLPFEIVKSCSLVAWSRGLKYFAVRDASKCLGDKHFLSTVLQLNAVKGCLGGRGGQNVSDVYRLKSKKTLVI